MALNVGELYASFGIDSKGLAGQLGGIEKQCQGMGKRLMGLGASIFAAFSVGKIGKEIINAGSSFEAAMSQVAATMGKTVDEISAIEEKALEMGSTTAFTATQAAEGMNILAQAGLEAEDQIASIDDVLNLAAAGGIEMSTAAGYVATAVKGWGDSFENASHYADIMAKGATLANTSVNELGDAMSGMAATANQYGQSVESTTVALLRLAEQSITGSEATTSLKRAMQIMYAPTKQQKEILDSLGVSAYDSAGNQKEFNQVIGELQDSMAGLSKEERAANISALFGARGLAVFNAMAATSADSLEKFWDGVGDAGGSAAKQASTQLDNLQGDVKLFKSAVEGLQIAVYKSMKGVLRDTVQAGTAVVDALHKAYDEGFSPENLGKVIDKAFDLMGTVAGKTGTLLMDLVEGFTQVMPTVINKMSNGIASALRGLAGRLPDLFRNLASALPSLFEGGGTIVIALSDALFSGISAAIDAIIPMLPSLAPRLFSAMAGLAASIGRGLLGIFDTIVNGLINGFGTEQIAEQLQETVNDTLEGMESEVTVDMNLNPEVQDEEAEVTKITDAIGGIFDEATTALTNGILKDDAEASAAASEAMNQQIADMVGSIDAWEKAKVDELSASGLGEEELQTQIAAVQAEAESMRTTLEGAQTEANTWLETYSEAPTSVVKAHASELDAILEHIGEVETQINEAVANLSPAETIEEGGAEQKAAEIAEKFLGVDGAAFENATQGLGTSIITGIINGINDATTQLTEAFRGLLEKAVDALSDTSETGLAAKVTEIGSSIIQGIADVFGTAGTEGGMLFTNLATAINEVLTPERVSGMLTNATSFATGILQAISDALQTVGDGGVNFIDGIVTAITTLMGTFQGTEFSGKLGGLAEAIINGIVNAFAAIQTAGGEIITSVIEGISNILSTINFGSLDSVAQAIMTAIGNGIDTLGSNGTVVVSTIVGAIKRLLNTVTSSDFTSGLGNLATTIITGIGTAIGKSFQNAGKIVDAIKDLLAGAMADGSLSDMGKNLAGLGAQIISAIAEGIKSAAGGAASLIRSIGELISTALSGDAENSIIGHLGDFGSTIIQALVAAIGDVGTAGIEILNAIGEAISGIEWDKVGDQLTGFARSIITSLAEAVRNEDFVSVVQNIGTAIGNAAGALVHAAGTLIGKLISFMLDPTAWAEFAEGVAGLIQVGLEGAWNALKAFEQKLVELNPDIELSIEDMPDLGEYIHTKFVQNNQDEWVEVVDVELALNYMQRDNYDLDTQELAAKFFQDQGLGTYEITDGVLSWYPSIEISENTDMDDLIEKFNTYIQEHMQGQEAEIEIPADIELDTSEGGGEFNYTEEATKKLEEMGIEVPHIDAEVDQINVETGNSSEIQQTTQEAVDQMLAGVSFSADVAVTANVAVTIGDSNAAEIGSQVGKDIGAGAVTALGGAIDTAVSSGRMFAQGFINGMGEKLEAVKNKAMELARAAVEALQRGIAQGSPSRITWESGEYFGEGFIRGIADKLRGVRMGASEMAKTAVDALNPAANAPAFAAQRQADAARRENEALLSGNLRQGEIVNGIASMIGVMREIMGVIPDGDRPMVLDSGELIHAIGGRMNQELGDIASWREGGRA